MDNSLHNSEIQFLEALYEATENHKIVWSIVEDEDRDLFHATLDGESINIELVYFEVATGGTFERLLAIISGLKVYIRASVGTPAYDIVSSMLSKNIPSWSQGRKGGINSLSKATSRINRFLESK